VGIGGKDIVDGNQKLSFGLFPIVTFTNMSQAFMTQVMQYHFFEMLKKLKFGGKEVSETDMISWCNQKVRYSPFSPRFI
jgi:hypothetical protein